MNVDDKVQEISLQKRSEDLGKAGRRISMLCDTLRYSKKALEQAQAGDFTHVQNMINAIELVLRSVDENRKSEENCEC